MVLLQKQAHWSMGLNWSHRNKSTHLWTFDFLIKKPKLYKGKGQLLQKMVQSFCKENGTVNRTHLLPIDWERSSQTLHLMEGYYLNFTKNSINYTPITQMTQLKIEYRNQQRIFNRGISNGHLKHLSNFQSR